MRPRENPRFHDRQEAGKLLAERLHYWRGSDALVLGIPRGGVPVAAQVARTLGLPLDVIVAHKIGSPSTPELAIGAVTAAGHHFFNEDAGHLDVDFDELASSLHRELAQARQRDRNLRGGTPPPPVAGRTVLLVDDGLATGATMSAAVHDTRERGASHIVVAVPVGSARACGELLRMADEVVCMRIPEDFRAVELHYEHFEAPTDDETRRLLTDINTAPSPTPAR